MKADHSSTMLRYIASARAAAMFFLLFQTLVVEAQDSVTGAFEGVVVNRQTNLPIGGATVRFINKDTGVPALKRTDAQGHFRHGLLPPGDYIIEVDAAGFKRATSQQSLPALRTIDVLPFQLDPIETQTIAPLSTGGLAVASVHNALIIVEAIRVGSTYEKVVPPDQSLCVFNLSPGSYRVTAKLEGYRQAQREVIVTAGEFLGVTLNLLPNEPSRLATSQVGQYYALVIGNNDYQHLPRLKTAENDAKAVEAILRYQYGFEAKLLLNANREQIIVALNEYRRKLDQNANLLIYYAGHGHNDNEVDRAYWLPVNARKEDNANWISADDITGNVKGISAKHVLVISDSCYSGAIVRGLDLRRVEPSARDKYLQTMASGKSRTLMASGGDEPVADGGGGGHSIFARAFITGLSQAEREVFTAEELYYDFIREAVTGKSNQTPQYNPIRNSGHERGDFVFVRKTK